MACEARLRDAHLLVCGTLASYRLRLRGRALVRRLTLRESHLPATWRRLNMVDGGEGRWEKLKLKRKRRRQEKGGRLGPRQFIITWHCPTEI